MADLVDRQGGTANGFHLQFHLQHDKKAIVRKQRRAARKRKSIHCKRAGLVEDERGMVTAEFAVVLMAVSLVMIMVVFAATVGVSYVKTQDTARQAARMIARGESQSVAVSQARGALPGASVTVNSSSDTVAVHVVSSVSFPVAKIRLGGITVSSTAHAPKEHHLASATR